MSKDTQDLFQKQLEDAQEAARKAQERLALLQSVESVMTDGRYILGLAESLALPLVEKGDLRKPEAIKEEVDAAIALIVKAAKRLAPQKLVAPAKRKPAGEAEAKVLAVLNDGNEHKARDIRTITGIPSLAPLLSKMVAANKILNPARGLYRKNG